MLLCSYRFHAKPTRLVCTCRTFYKTGNVRITWHWEAFACPLLPWKSNKCYVFWMCVCSLSYPAYWLHAPYYSHLWSGRRHHIFPHYLTNDTIFWGKKSYWTSYVLIFFYNLRLKHFSFEEELSEILSWMCIRYHVKYPLFLSDFNQTWVFWTDFRKIMKHQISRKSVQWDPSCSLWRDTEAGR
jgi:hypothetical protein